MSDPRAAIIGAGAIAPYHIAALRAAGFRVSHIAARESSTRAAKLATKLNIDKVWSNAEDLVSSNDWDALVIATTPESIPGLLRLAIETGRPCLVEKPVALESTLIRQFEGNDSTIRVAFNRRFYSSSLAARSFAAEGPCMFHMELPERIDSTDCEMAGLRSVKENSVHGFDLLSFILGRYRVMQEIDVKSPRGRIVLLTSETGHVGTMTLNWNCPVNVSLVLDRPPHRLELRPFELASLYEGMDVLEPSADVPVRRYVPKLRHTTNSFPGLTPMKPGFLEQSRSLLSAVQRGEWDARSATIGDAAFAADIASQLTH